MRGCALYAAVPCVTAAVSCACALMPKLRRNTVQTGGGGVIKSRIRTHSQTLGVNAPSNTTLWLCATRVRVNTMMLHSVSHAFKSMWKMRGFCACKKATPAATVIGEGAREGE